VEIRAEHFPAAQTAQRPRTFRLRTIVSGDERRNEGGILTEGIVCGKRKLAEDAHGRPQSLNRILTAVKRAADGRKTQANGETG